MAAQGRFNRCVCDMRKLCVDITLVTYADDCTIRPHCGYDAAKDEIIFGSSTRNLDYRKRINDYTVHFEDKRSYPRYNHKYGRPCTHKGRKAEDIRCCFRPIAYENI